MFVYKPLKNVMLLRAFRFRKYAAAL